MTEIEAIKELSYDNTAYGGRCTEEVRRVAIHALSEIQQYRAIGTVEEIEKSMQNVSVLLAEHELLKLYQAIGTIDEFKALKEKNEPKEVAYQIDTSGHKHEKCPACGSFHVFGKHCTECGQSIVEWWK